MKKFITILISCSLALAASAIAQQDDDQGKVKKGKDQGQPAQTAPEVKTPKNKSMPKEHAETKVHDQQNAELKGEATGGTPKMQGEKKVHGMQNAELKTESTGASKTGAETKVNADVNANETGNAMGAGKGKHGKNARATTEATTGATGSSGATTGAATATETGNAMGAGKGKHGKMEHAAVTGATGNSGATTGAVNTQTSTAATLQTNQPNLKGNVKMNAQGKKQPAPEMIQKIRTEHASFRAQARPDKAPAVTFNANFRLEGSDRWQGSQYEVYRSYHPERHDRGWYSSHYNRVELVGGGYYYWNNGYWYPAWGYDSSAEYYAYDAPIYVGSHAERRPDQVIADVQSSLQEMGYYQGEVDGLLGPLTRQALTSYQSDNGLYTTATIDEPTLDALGMG